MGRLDGKIAIVTGSAGGIGRAIAIRFAAEGANVWITDIAGEAAEATAGEIRASGGAATAMVADVSRGQDVTALMRAIEAAHGKADILVNNAGILVRGEVRNISDAEWTRLRDVNLDGVFRMSRDALPLLRKGEHASIINISSIMSHRGLRPLAAYTATKGAVTALTKGLAVEYAPFNIRVNAIEPGYVETAITDRMLKLPQAREALVGKTPMGRLGKPEDMTGAAVFFASDDSIYCTGAVLAVDGGMSAGL
jgi:cyclopentanol dehydrogenase